jgi:hypothetical protein
MEVCGTLSVSPEVGDCPDGERGKAEQQEAIPAHAETTACSSKQLALEKEKERGLLQAKPQIFIPIHSHHPL